jgi:hypothetical protein
MDDDPEHFILLHAAVMQRLHRTTGSIVDNSKHPPVRQQPKLKRSNPRQDWENVQD